MEFTVLNAASIEENESLNMSIAIQPNPASKYFFVNYAMATGHEGEIILTDALGKLIRKVQVQGQAWWLGPKVGIQGCQ